MVLKGETTAIANKINSDILNQTITSNRIVNLGTILEGTEALGSPNHVN